jgi:hypothetical protein
MAALLPFAVALHMRHLLAIAAALLAAALLALVSHLARETRLTALLIYPQFAHLSALARKRRQLTSPRSRRALSRALRQTAASTEPPSWLDRCTVPLRCTVPPLGDRVEAVRSELLHAATALERNHDPNPASVALIRELLSAGASPLYNPNTPSPTCEQPSTTSAPASDAFTGRGARLPWPVLASHFRSDHDPTVGTRLSVFHRPGEPNNPPTRISRSRLGGSWRQEEAMTLHPTRIAARLLAFLAVTVGLASVVAAPASAATVQVAGVQSAPLDTVVCPFQTAGLPAYTMAGGLIGCWYTDTIVTHAAQPNGTPSGEIQATGTEHFDGCLDLNGDGRCDDGDPTGTLAFTYQLSIKLDPGTGAEIHGRCHHPIVPGSGTDGFTGATGVITFKDDVANGTAPYRGHITF